MILPVVAMSSGGSAGSGEMLPPDGSGGSSGMTPPDESGVPHGPQQLLILHTNDLHSHLMGQGPERDYTPATTGDDATRGGMARLATAVGGARAQAAAAGRQVLLLDAGDFMMGTLFELLATLEVPELRLMQALGYDATTLGNHELDWTPQGLAAILQAAATKQVTLPILSSNMGFSATESGDDALQALVAATGALRPKLVKTVGGIKVGLFGLLGANAVQVTPQARPLTFEAIDVAAARMVAELRDVDQVDLVIALSHSGIDHEGKGEDAALAAAVPGIDVIVSGHTHDTLSQPARVGDTLIVTAGSYTGYLGELALTVTPAAVAGERASVAVDGYTLREIDDSLPGDATTQAGIDQIITGLDRAALGPRGLGYRQVIAETAGDLLLPAAAEAPVGNLVSDAYRTVVSALQPSAPPVFAFEANGQLRAPILKGTTGEIWFADLFRVLPIGIGPDQVPGYPLVSYYLSASDLRSGLELGGAPELAGNDAFLQVSGLEVEYDRSKPPFQRVSRLALVTSDGAQTLDPTDTTRCYQIVTTNYLAGLLSLVRTITGGLLAVDAKDADCSTLVDPTIRFVDADPVEPGVQELKHWQALYGFASRFADTDADGVPDVPSAYLAPQGRIVER
ncbi:MAG: bifunctional metallophosphatase/5'-nucleotidase [Deltaproteobacteria bacterium]